MGIERIVELDGVLSCSHNKHWWMTANRLIIRLHFALNPRTMTPDFTPAITIPMPLGEAW